MLRTKKIPFKAIYICNENVEKLVLQLTGIHWTMCHVENKNPMYIHLFLLNISQTSKYFHMFAV